MKQGHWNRQIYGGGWCPFLFVINQDEEDVMTRIETIKRLEHLVKEVPRLRQLKYDNLDYRSWRNQVRDVLGNIFGRDSEEYKRLQGKVSLSEHHASEAQKQQLYCRVLEHDVLLLGLIVDRLSSVSSSQIVYKESGAEYFWRGIKEGIAKALEKGPPPVG